MAKPIFGVTLDGESGASTAHLNAVYAALVALPQRATVRIVCDPGEAPSKYVPSVNKYKTVADIMLMPVDSTSLNEDYYSALDGGVDAYGDRFDTYLDTFTDPTIIWEAGNELGGEWLYTHNGNPGPGPNLTRLAGQQLVADKVTEAYDRLAARGRRIAITLWEDNFGTNYCGASGQWEMHPQEITALFPSYVKTGTDYLFVSWYPTQCSGKNTTTGNLVGKQPITDEMVSLHGLWPNADLGFGELGFPRPIPLGGSLVDGEAMATYYYGLGNLGLDYYCGGYFWWYWDDDCVTTPVAGMYEAIRDAMGTGDYIVPTTIPTSAIGAALTTDVTTAANHTANGPLNKFVADDVPSGANTRRMLFQPSRVYHGEAPLNFLGKTNLQVVGQGATLRAALKGPDSFVITDGWVKTKATTNNTQQLFKSTTAEPDFSPLQGQDTLASWYVVGDDMPGPQPAIQRTTHYTSNTQITVVQPAISAPATNLRIEFSSPNDRTRSTVFVQDCVGVTFTGLKITGQKPQPNGYDATYEAQCGFDIVESAYISVTNCTIQAVWGDGIQVRGLKTAYCQFITVTDNTIFNIGRHGFNVNGGADVTFSGNQVSDCKRHIVDIEPNGTGQVCRRITMTNNDTGYSVTGTLAISTYQGASVDVGDITFSGNRITNNDLFTPVGNNMDATLARWGPFTISNNTVTGPPIGTGSIPGAWHSGQAYRAAAPGVPAALVTDFSESNDSWWQCKLDVTSTTPPHLDLTHWRRYNIWTQIPAVIKFQYCDGITVVNNVMNMQDGRTMYGVWAQNCTDINVHGNHDHTTTDAIVLPHQELRVVGGSVTVPGTGTAHLGGTFTGTGTGQSSTTGTGAAHLGGTFTGTGHAHSEGTGSAHFGGTFTGTGRGDNRGTGSAHLGGTFTGSGESQGVGTGRAHLGGRFRGSGRHATSFGTGTCHLGGTFTGTGGSPAEGTGTCHLGGTFTGVGRAQNTGSGTCHLGGGFTGRGHGIDSRYQDGEWVTGGVKLRGPGWDDLPWDTGPWDGEE